MNNIYYIDAATNEQHGPFSLSELKTKNISPSTMVWESGMPNWAPASSVGELKSLFEGRSFDEVSEQAPSNYHNTTGYKSMYDSNVFGTPLVQQKADMGLPAEPMPKTWLLESVLFAIMCCSIIGIVGIYYASRVSKLYIAGDYEASLAASKSAKTWTFVGLGINVGFIVISIIIEMLSY